MLFGVLLHATPDGGKELLFTGIAYISARFRMGSFIVISGFLTGLLACRRDGATWIRARTAALLPPTLTGLAITLPAMAALRLYEGKPLGIVTLLFEWYHMWFLVALLAYLPIAQWLAFGTGARAIRALFGSASLAGSGGALQLRVVLGTCLAAFALLLLGTALTSMVRTDGRTILNFLPQTLCYAPLYAMGILLGRNPEICRPLPIGRLAPALLTLGLIAVLVIDLAAISVLPYLPLAVATILTSFALAAAPTLASLRILRSALAIRRVPNWVHHLSRASLTIYIAHYPLVKLLHALCENVIPNRYVEFGFVVVVAVTLCWAFHVLVVARSPVLRYLFNGKGAPRLAVQRELI